MFFKVVLTLLLLEIAVLPNLEATDLQQHKDVGFIHLNEDQDGGPPRDLSLNEALSLIILLEKMKPELPVTLAKFQMILLNATDKELNQHCNMCFEVFSFYFFQFLLLK